MWPAGKDQFREVINPYAKLLGNFTEFALEVVFESYGARKHYASFAASNSHVIRFLKYKPIDTDNKKRHKFKVSIP
ncbi:hypothetical protein FEM48_Zijuj05G0020900 [Ziziphus jujuba var. spinosa]|uniref:Uncharacterized protein n=1 Tax=Ziziphus jujuba var. spinosa TaxID=714518 RepID=A0A978VC66_ZIZJJ|nr:hypothetical protein FEM48_Zijuj05G0020900 [Ziziphus jujuba var. spinosa]